jgi:hypothetical protein
MRDLFTHKVVVLVGIPVGTAVSDLQQQLELKPSTLQACANVGCPLTATGPLTHKSVMRNIRAACVHNILLPV